MSKKTSKVKSKTLAAKLQASATGAQTLKGFTAQLPAGTPYLVIFLFACLLYSNTLWNKYAMDDTVVITENRFSKKGFQGIIDHFTHDGSEGFYGEQGAKTVSGGRYRPLNSAVLSLEYELMRKIRNDPRREITDSNIIMGEEDPYLNPMLSHAINILLFASTCILLFYFLQQVIPASAPGSLGIPLIATMLYVAHPLHTEAVANIKGRDEIMCILFSLLALVAAIKYVNTQKPVHLAGGMLAYFLALLSKENAITFIAIVPLTFFFFTRAKLKDYLVVSGLYLIPFIVFLLIRAHYTRQGLTQDSTDILTNPFLLATRAERYATTVLTFLYYFKLLLIPYPLTHDYYYNQIPYVEPGDFLVIFSFIINLALIAYAFVNLKKKTIPSYAIFFYFITFSITSNLFFTVGVLMNERFVFMSSLGFCLLAAYLLVSYIKDQKLLAGIFMIPLLLYSVITFSRNFNWKTDLSLFTQDINQSPNSGLMQYVYGAELSKAAGKKLNPDEKNLLLDSAIVHLAAAVEILPKFAYALNDYASSVYNRSQNSEKAIPILKKAIFYSQGEYYDAYFNIAIAYYSENKLLEAKENLARADVLKPSGSDCKYLLAEICAKLNQADSVEFWLKRGEQTKPVDAHTLYLIAFGFGTVANNLPKTIEFLNKAIALAPGNELYYENLAEIYGKSGKFDDAIKTSQKLIEINPNYSPAYKNLAIYYNVTGNKDLARQYQEKYNELITGHEK